MSDQLSAARAAVDTADAVVARAAQHLAEVSAEDGKISVARLDQHQTLAYDLAHAAAAVEGSKVMCTYAEHGEIESMLARAYVADAVWDVATRMLGRTATWDGLAASGCRMPWPMRPAGTRRGDQGPGEWVFTVGARRLPPRRTPAPRRPRRSRRCRRPRARPAVSVPVLSNSTMSTDRIRSRASRSFTRIPAFRRNGRGHAITSGIASPSAWGQAITSTVTCGRPPRPTLRSATRRRR